MPHSDPADAQHDVSERKGDTSQSLFCSNSPKKLCARLRSLSLRPTRAFPRQPSSRSR